jgi:catechol 2,3-dioxygenase-like lactoylglutathione lyase family enzyme
MEQRLSIVTLGVKDLARSRHFYEALGWAASPKSDGDIVFFQAGGMAIALYPWTLLAKDATVKPDGSGFQGITLAHNVRDKNDVANILKEAEKAGAKILKPAQDVFWGGHSGYFSDPDGHLWEVAWNPHSKLDANGQFIL